MLSRIISVLVLLGVLRAPGADQPVPFEWNWKQNHELNAGESLQNAVLRGVDKTSLRLALLKAFQSYLSFSPPNQKELDQIILNTRVRAIRLTQDRALQVIAQAGDEAGGCAPVGNCPIWIFKRAGDTYVPILESQGQTIQVLQNKTSGYRDFMVGAHGSAFETELHIYRVRDGIYHEEECYDAFFQVSEGRRQKEPPQITRCKQ